MNNNNKKAEYWKLIVGILTAGWVAIWVYRTALAPIYPEISRAFGGLSKSQLGFISSFYFLGYLLMQIPSGILVDKFGQKKVILPGFALFGMGTLLVGLSQTIDMVYIGGFLAGVGCGTYYGAAYSLTAKYVPKHKKSLATAIVNSGTALGSGIGMISSSYFVSQLHLPWPYMLFFTLFLIVLMLVIFYRFIAVDKPEKNAQQLNEQTKNATIQALFKPTMLGAYALYFATCYAYYLVDTWLPHFLSEERGFQGAFIGIASSLVFFSAVPGALLFSRLADKYMHKKVSIIIGLECIAAIMLILSMVSVDNTLMMLALILYGFFGKLAVEPIIISWIGERAPSTSVATTLGVFNFFGMTSSVIVPSLTGYISEMTGSTSNAFYLASGIIFVATIIFLMVNRPKTN